jgi:hypothetical protein
MSNGETHSTFESNENKNCNWNRMKLVRIKTDFTDWWPVSTHWTNSAVVGTQRKEERQTKTQMEEQKSKNIKYTYKHVDRQSRYMFFKNPRDSQSDGKKTNKPTWCKNIPVHVIIIRQSKILFNQSTEIDTERQTFKV